MPLVGDPDESGSCNASARQRWKQLGLSLQHVPKIIVRERETPPTFSAHYFRGILVSCFFECCIFSFPQRKWWKCETLKLGSLACAEVMRVWSSKRQANGFWTASWAATTLMIPLAGSPTGRFLCKRMQETPLRFPPENHFSKLRGNLGIVSSEIMAEIHKKSRLGFVLVCRGDPWTLRMVGIFWFIQLDAIDAIHRIDASCPQFAV